MKQRIGILVCENLLNEVTTALANEGLTNEVEVISYVSHCYPSGEWQAQFENALLAITESCRRFCIVRCSFLMQLRSLTS